VSEINVDAAEPPRAGPRPAWLIPISGPPLHPIQLKSKEGGLIIGRAEGCDLHLASDAVSRFHARLTHEDRWGITDLKSRWGTYLNGCRISPEVELPLQSGDLLRISPWTFNFSDAINDVRGVAPVNDLAQRQTLVGTVTTTAAAGSIAENRLSLLLEMATAMQGVADERALAQILLETAQIGGGLPNAAVLRPVDGDGRIEVIASRQSAMQGALFSRSLLNAASQGVMATFSPEYADSPSQSILSMKIDAAVCVPLMLGSAVAAYLYLDDRGNHATLSPQQWSASKAFFLALGRIASLALANLKRIDIERRAAHVEAELRAGAEAQRWVMPRREIELHPFRCAGESRPGRCVGGDFFDFVTFGDERIIVALGDVVGKGVPASVLMTSAQGFLNSALQQDGRPDVAVTQLNRFILPRRPSDRFLTLWVGCFDLKTRQLHYVDAGHGYALLRQDGQAPRRLDEGDNLPVGVADSPYKSACLELPESGQVIVVSDGIIEQRNPPAEGCEFGVPFGIEGLAATLKPLNDPGAALTPLFDAVTRHAGTSTLSDDATAVIVRW
jgi:serine phosphatase RsbU (regulator of sigma subunit)